VKFVVAHAYRPSIELPLWPLAREAEFFAKAAPDQPSQIGCRKL